MTQAASSAERAPTVQKSEEKGQSGGGQRSGAGALKVQLKGRSFDEGAAMLAPIQRKATDTSNSSGNTQGTTNASTTATGSEQEHGGDNGQQPATEHAAKVGKVSTIKQLFDTAGTIAETMFVRGGALKLAVEGEISFWKLLGVGAKIELEVADAGHGKLETSAQFHIGAGLMFEAGIEEIAKAEFKAMACGDYALKAKGDSIGECVRLMMLGVQASMNNAAASHSAEADKEKADKEPWYKKAWEAIKSVAALPGKLWSWSMNGLIKLAWGSADFAKNLETATTEMDEQDSIEVTRGAGFEAGAGLSVGGVGGKVEGETYDNAKKTSIKKGADGELEVEEDKGTRTKLSFELGKEHVAKVKVELDEYVGKETESELLLELEGNMTQLMSKGVSLVMGAVQKLAGKSHTAGHFASGDAEHAVADGLKKAEAAHTAGGHDAHGGGHGGGHGDHHGPQAEAGIELKFKWDPSGQKFKLQAVELLFKVAIEIPIETGIVGGKVGGSATRKVAVYHDHGDGHEEGGDKGGGHH